MGERPALSRDNALRSQTRIDLLFTMSEIPHAHPEGRRMRSDVFADDKLWRSGRPVFAPASPFGLCRAAPRVAEGEAWWSQTGSNRRPHACKARALPAELWPRTRRRMLLPWPA